MILPASKQEDWFEKTRSYMVNNDKEIKGFFGDYMFLSNFYVSKFYLSFPYGEIKFESSEAAYQGMKSGKVEDLQRFSKYSPRLAQKEGQNVELQENWDTSKAHTMFLVCLEKFHQNEELKEKLLCTEEKYLEETNHWNDTYWGVDYRSGKGKNTLGQILMMIRSFIQDY